MKKTKKILSLMLSLTMILSVLSAAIITADGATTKKNKNYKYQIIGNKVKILSYIGSNNKKKVKIPSKINGRSVTIIGKYAFGYDEHGDDQKVENVVIPNTVTCISDHAFGNCKYLKKVNIPSSVTSIGDYALSGVKWKSLTLPGTVTQIGKGAFSGCNKLKKLTVKKGIVELSDSMFSYCKSLTKVSLPKGLTYIGEKAFSNCSSLTNIKIPNSVRVIDNLAFSNTNTSKITLPGKTYLNDYSLGFNEVYSNSNYTYTPVKSFTVKSLCKYGKCQDAIRYANENGFNIIVKLDNEEQNEIKAFIGNSFKLKTTKKVKEWESSDTTVATVNQNGKVKTLKKGIVTITATTAKDVIECEVTVRK